MQRMNLSSLYIKAEERNQNELGKLQMEGGWNKRFAMPCEKAKTKEKLKCIFANLRSIKSKI
jgi:hypothetical protein